MPRLHTSMTTLIGLALLISAPSPADAREPKNEFERRLDKGKIFINARPVRGYDQPMGVLRAVINAPPEIVWPLVGDCARYKTTMNRVLSSKKKLLGGGKMHCTVKIDMPFPYGDIESTTLSVVKEDPKTGTYSRKWKMLAGEKAYKVNKGSWKVTRFLEDPNRTLVLYKAHGIPSAWVPDWVLTMARDKSLPKMIKRIRKLAKKAWKK
jgi:hypothetical protein